MMGNIETFPSKQMYLYISLVERKVAEFQHNIDREGTIRFGFDLFSSLFRDNCPYPCFFFLQKRIPSRPPVAVVVKLFRQVGNQL